MKRDEIDLCFPTGETLIQGYTFKARAVREDAGTLPLSLVDGEMGLHDALDIITCAVEAGHVQRAWHLQLFKTPEDLDWFLAELEYYDECYRITDRWWQALATLAGVLDEEDFVSSAEIATTLRETIERNEAYLRDRPALIAHRLKQPDSLQRPLTPPQSVVLERMNRKAQSDPSVVAEHASVRHLSGYNYPRYYVENGMLYVREATEADFKAKPAAKRTAARKTS